MKKIVFVLALCWVLGALPGFAQVRELGSGSYTETLPGGVQRPQEKRWTVAGWDKPVPTNDWWSSLVWEQFSERMFPHPLSVWYTNRGLEIDYPWKTFAPQSFGEADLVTPHIADLTVGAREANPRSALLAEAGDFSVTGRMDMGGSAYVDSTVTHGSPFVYFTYVNVSPRVRFAEPPAVWSGGAGDNVLGLTVSGRHYALFAPTGAEWIMASDVEAICSLPGGGNHLSVAVLPDSSAATLDEFKRYAYAHITDTRVDWSYDRQDSSVVTSFGVVAEAKEGEESGSLLAMYPHQARFQEEGYRPGYAYTSARGPMTVVEGNFTTRTPFHGVLPWLPMAGVDDPDQLRSLVKAAEITPGTSKLNYPWDSYWGGKYVGRLANLAAIAEQIGEHEAADGFKQEMRGLVEDWLTAVDGEDSGLFWYDRNWGTLIGLKPSYGSDFELNDHHFHYGYWATAAAQLALRDPNWAKQMGFGAMVEFMMRDYAEADRDGSLFPFLRNFDPYAGHSWASGRSRFADGNNQESSSEAVNAYAALILWGEATGNMELRDLGVYLYATETEAVRNYWFDVYGDTFDPDYPSVDVSMVWGGKSVHTTWWTDDPIQVHGINLLPLGGHSLYLGLDPGYVERKFDAMLHEYALRGSAPTMWQDILACYLAMADPQRAEGFWNPGMAVEDGESAAHAYHWIQTFKRLGRVDPDVRADTALYAVFVKNGVRTYVAFNADDTPRNVAFSDGYIMAVAANSMTVNGVSGGSVDDPGDDPGDGQVDDPADDGGDTGIGGDDGGDDGSTGGSTQAFTATASEIGPDRARVVLTVPAGAQWADIHYLVNGAGQQNFRMDAAGGGFLREIGGLKANDVVTYWFTYEKDRLACDTHNHQYTHVGDDGGTGNDPDDGSTGGDTGGEDPGGDLDSGTATLAAVETSAYQLNVALVVSGSDWADLHYAVNHGGQLNYRMARTATGHAWDIPGLSPGDAVEYWCTYWDGSAARDTGRRTHVFGTADPGDPGTGDPDEGGADNGIRATAQPVGISGVRLVVVADAGWADVHYVREGQPQQNVRMSAASGGFEHVVNGLRPGETVTYWFTVGLPWGAVDLDRAVYTNQ